MASRELEQNPGQPGAPSLDGLEAPSLEGLVTPLLDRLPVGAPGDEDTRSKASASTASTAARCAGEIAETLGLLRSEEMRHGTLILQADYAADVLDQVGVTPCMQLEDMNAKVLVRPYRKHVQRIDELERIMRFLVDEITRLPGSSSQGVVKGHIDSYLRREASYSLKEMEPELKRLYEDFLRSKRSTAEVLTSLREADEALRVVQMALDFTGGSTTAQQKRSGEKVGHFGASASPTAHFVAELAEFTPSLDSLVEPLPEVTPEVRGITTLAGIIAQSDEARFTRTLHRATFGNIFIHSQGIDEPMTDPHTTKQFFGCVFVVCFQGRHGGHGKSAMVDKVKAICAAYNARTYEWYETRSAALEAQTALTLQVADQKKLLDNLRRFMQQEAMRLLKRAAPDGNSIIEEWRLYCAKQKSIFAALNRFEGTGSLRASCWYLAKEENRINGILRKLKDQHSTQAAMLVPDRKQPRVSPPTYIRTNALTEAIQMLVDTYGLPRYMEANPALPSIVTFPFLFGVMYGDVGHGLMVFLIGAWLVRNAERVRSELPGLYVARYLVLMMGFFAVYAGFLYNDFFSVGIPLFASRWKMPDNAPRGSAMVFEPLYDTKNLGGRGPYPIGIDPAWHGAENELIFANSLKMKLAVIIGVIHMAGGLVLRCLNAVNDGNMVDLICECVPMMIFMASFFGFMDFMILYKWVQPRENPPSIINSMICMALPGTEDPSPLFGAALPAGLMKVALLMIPWILIPKPFLLWIGRRSKIAQAYCTSGGMQRPGPDPMREDTGIELGKFWGATSDSSDNEEGRLNAHGGVDDHEEFDVAEVCIHQTIETIEYVLGTVSHVASYLRLWALSLAHQQLSQVFFRYTLLNGMALSFPANTIAIYIAFIVWLAVTVAVLLCMDVLECFLHTLRLHWVEFQSKFYKADGYAFEPVYHRKVLEASDT